MAAQRTPDFEPARKGGDGKELTIMEHLAEFRQRLFISALAIAIGTVVGLIFSKPLITFLEQPAKSVDPGFIALQVDPFEFVTAYFKIALLAGIMLALPVLLFEFLAFVVPALTTTEKRWLFPILFSALALFAIGVVFSYYLVVPRTLDFLLNFGKGQVKPEIRIGSYIDTVGHLLFWTGLMFELPLLMMVPAKFGIVTPKRYLKWWRYAIVFAFVCAAAVIPNINPLLQVIVAGPIILLYLSGVGLAWIVQPRRTVA